MKIDFHSHILPGIDDGSRNVDESLQILSEMTKDGVDIVCATPHFYNTQQSFESFIENRNKAYELLKQSLPADAPKILLGGEVLFSETLINISNPKALCLEGTNYVLLEMPYCQLTDELLGNVQELINIWQKKHGIKFLIAHIERYLFFTSLDELMKLMEMDVLGQINCKSLFVRKTRKETLNLIKSGYVQVLGTDYHRIDRGDILIGQVEKIISKKVGKDVMELVEQAGEILLADGSTQQVLDVF